MADRMSSEVEEDCVSNGWLWADTVRRALKTIMPLIKALGSGVVRRQRAITDGSAHRLTGIRACPLAGGAKVVQSGHSAHLNVSFQEELSTLVLNRPIGQLRAEVDLHDEKHQSNACRATGAKSPKSRGIVDAMLAIR